MHAADQILTKKPNRYCAWHDSGTKVYCSLWFSPSTVLLKKSQKKNLLGNYTYVLVFDHKLASIQYFKIIFNTFTIIQLKNNSIPTKL